MSSSKCQIVKTLGVGGMATVYLAELASEDGSTRRVALKKPHAFLAQDAATLAVLEDEAQLGACIRHPNVVGVIELVRGDEPALVMEWVDGVDLAALVRAAQASGRPLPVDVAAAVARDMLSGLHAAHDSRRADGLALDIVHRDVSPQNVLVGLDGIVRVADFGVAKAAWRQQHTEQGSVKGKLGYLAPEQLGGRCDRRADVYGVGAVLWELLTGTRLRTGDGVEMLVAILNGHVAAPSTIAAAAAALDSVVMRALERCPEERFATAAAMVEAIDRAIVVASPERVATVVRNLTGAPEQRDATVGADERTVTMIPTLAELPKRPELRQPTPVRIACEHPRTLRVRCPARTPRHVPEARFLGPPPTPAREFLPHGPRRRAA